MNALHTKLICAKLGGNWHGGSGEEDSKFGDVFELFRYFPPSNRCKPSSEL